MTVMFQDAFIKLTPADAKAALEEINPALEGAKFNPENATVLGQDLSFYPGYRFLDIADYETTPHMRKYIIYRQGSVSVIDWTNRPVYELNKKLPVKLNRNTVTDYLRFFLTYIRGPHGFFRLVENVDDICWADEPPPAARKAVGKILEPLRIVEEKDDGSYHLAGCLIFSGTLYKAEFFVAAGGQVTIKDETVLADEMPVLDDTLRQ